MKRVLLVKSENLFAGGLASLIYQANEINLLNRTIKDLNQLIKEIRDLHPNILVLNKSLHFATSPSVLGLLSKFPDIRILVVDELKNIIHVYEKHEVEVNQSADLIGLINKES